jgi:hypothetical protein
MRVAYEGRLENDTTMKGAMDVISSPLSAPTGTRGTFTAYKGSTTPGIPHKAVGR